MRFTVGKIINTHSLKGELKVFATTDFADERFLKGNKLLATRGNQVVSELEIESSRVHKGFYLIKFVGIDDINEAEKYKNLKLKINEEDLRKLDADEYYYYEIIDCFVYDLSNNLIGKIVNILQTGANDVWVVKSDDNKEYLIPYIDDVVKDIDISNKKIFIEVMEGLFD